MSTQISAPVKIRRPHRAPRVRLRWAPGRSPPAARRRARRRRRHVDAPGHRRGEVGRREARCTQQGSDRRKPGLPQLGGGPSAAAPKQVAHKAKPRSREGAGRDAHDDRLRPSPASRRRRPPRRPAVEDRLLLGRRSATRREPVPRRLPPRQRPEGDARRAPFAEVVRRPVGPDASSSSPGPDKLVQTLPGFADSETVAQAAVNAAHGIAVPQG